MATQPYDWRQRQQQLQSGAPSPYMQSSSAGNPPSSYASYGGASAGAWGQPAPTYQQPRTTTQQPTQPWSAQQYQPPQARTGPTMNARYTGPTQPPQPAFQAPYQGAPYQQVVGAYQQYLGRTPNPTEVTSQLQRHTPQEVINALMSSQERQAFLARQQQPQPAPPPQQGPQGPLSYDQWMQQLLQPYQPQGGGGGAGVPANADTDGYARPQFTVPATGHPPPGWDRAKWANPAHQTPKYVVGRILARVSPRTANMPKVLAMIQQAYPGTRQVSNGDINIPGVGTIDILTNADVGGKAWHWGTASPKGAAATAQTPAATTPATDPYAALIASLLNAKPPAAQTTAPPPPQPVAQPSTAQAPAAPNPQVVQLQAQLAQMQQQMQQAQQQQQLQAQQLQTWQAEQRAAPRGNQPSFQYY